MAIALSSITKSVRNRLPPRVVVHGPHGVGKSTLGASAYNPVFLPLEDGLSGLEVDAFPLLTSYPQVREALQVLRTSEHAFGTVVVDSLDWLEPLIQAETCARNKWTNIEAPGYGKGYAEAANDWREFLDLCNALRTERGMAVVLIAHSEIKRFEAPDTEAFERYQIKLQRSAAALVQEWADVIGFAQFETAIKKEAVGMNQRARGIATGRRLLHVTEKPAYVAKNRYGMADTLELSWSALIAAMNPPAAAQAA